MPPEDWQYPDLRIALFARAPVPGKVKTRMQPALSARRAAALHRRMVRHALAVCCRARLAPVVLLAGGDHPWLRQQAALWEVEYMLQRGDDLGARMLDACSRLLLTESRGVLLLGTDCPGIEADWLGRALGIVAAGRIALGPALDGGYVGLGLSQPRRELFEDMPWGSARVLEITRERLRSLGLAWRELEPLPDIDHPQDLARLPRLRRR